jgi:hypothetical protein
MLATYLIPSNLCKLDDDMEAQIKNEFQQDLPDENSLEQEVSLFD